MFKKGVDESKIVEFLQNKLSSGNLRRKLTIVDPYFFSSSIRFGFGNTSRRIEAILDPFKNHLEYLEIIAASSKINQINVRDLSQRIYYSTIEVIPKDDFHDRYWIIDERLAFVVGTSVNSFGNKHFFIQDDFLSHQDTQVILSLFKTELETV